MCCLKLIDDRRMDQGVDVSWKASVLWAGKPVCCELESRCASPSVRTIKISTVWDHITDCGVDHNRVTHLFRPSLGISG